MDHERREIGIRGEDGLEEVFGGDGEGMALVCADEVVGGIGVRGIGVCGFHVEALLGVGGYDGLELGEGEGEGVDFWPGELLVVEGC